MLKQFVALVSVIKSLYSLACNVEVQKNEI